MMQRDAPAAAREVLADIAGELGKLFTALQPVARGFAHIVGLSRHVEREDLTDLRGVISDVLASQAGLVAGAGVITAPHLLVDAPYWMEWWWAVPDKEPEALRVNLEPSAPDFFDYTSADWFVTPQRSGKRHIAGPYVDYVCTNEYTMTLALPVAVRDEFVGVVGIDVTISGWERRILPKLQSLPEPMTLTNAAGRVIASTSAFLSPGQRLDLAGIAAADTDTGEENAPSSAFGWRLVTDADALRAFAS